MTASSTGRLRPPLKRAATYRGAARRDRILEEGARLFLARGFLDVSVDEIVQAVGGSKTNVYSSFGSKEGLFLYVVQSMCDSALHVFSEMEVSHLPASEGLAALAHALLDAVLEERIVALRRLALSESGRFVEVGRTWFKSGPERGRAVIRAYIEKRQLAGDLREGDASMMATLFEDMVTSNPSHLAAVGMRPSTRQLHRHVSAVVQLFLLGAAPRTSSGR